MRKQILILSFIVITLPFLSAQRGYIVQGSSSSSGLRIQSGSDKENSQFIRVKANDRAEWIEYTPNDILEYGFKNGDVYVSLEVTIQGKTKAYFLRRIFEGDYNIYLLNVDSIYDFYIDSKDSDFVKKIPEDKNSRTEFLSSYLENSSRSLKNLQYIKTSESSLVRLFSDHDSGSNSYFPIKRFSIGIGFNSYNFLNNNAQIESIESLDRKNNLSVTALVDIPVATSNFSIEGGIGYQSFNSSNVFSRGNSSFDFVSNYSRLNLPISLKHTFYNLKKSPFIKAGVIYSRAIESASTLHTYTELDNTVFIEIDDSSLISPNYLSFLISAGLVLNYDSNHSFALELAYSRSSSLLSSNNALGINQISILLSMLL